MWFQRIYWQAALACQFLAIVAGDPQNVYQQYPNGQLKLLNGNNMCGTCPAGTVREAANGPFCGRCVPPSQSCAPGHYMDSNSGQCQVCPCPSADRKFGTSCRVDSDGHITCDCPSEYVGRDCSQCAPGTIQNNYYPHNCIRVNSTNSFATTCGAGNRCTQPSIQQITKPMPIQTGLCPISNPNPCSPNQCNTQCPCPNPCPCPQNGCTGGCPAIQPPCNIPPVIPPWKPQPPPPCLGPVQCPLTPTPCGTGCPQSPCGNNGCSQNPPCPVNGNGGGCPQIPQCPVNGNGNPGGCPQNPPCPGNNGSSCPQNPPCPGNVSCPQIPPCPTIPNPPPCPPQTPCPNPCQPCNEQTICPNPCPSQCAPCPQIPPCPECPQCPPCEGGGPGCVNCPNPCQPCPNPCQKCPDVRCPDCQKCPDCICGDGPGPEPIRIEPCVCDPRGTASMAGSMCVCKANVEGAKCDKCKKGYFALSSTRPEGCIACFCSGLTDSCLAAPYYLSSIKTDRSLNCSIQLTDEKHTVVYAQGSSGFTYDGVQATLAKSANQRLFWSLPGCMKGNRVTSYGGLLSFSRMCSGSGSPLGADHEVMLVAGSGASVFWTTFSPQKCDGQWNYVEVLLAEPAYWSSWKGEQYRRATRGDIMEVLADLQLILVRATFASSTSGTSIRNVSLTTVSHRRSTEGIALQIESCRCPTGYRGLSCENCAAPGYYRDTSDMSKSIFGSCKPCPCGKTADGCHFAGGEVVCLCKPGFTGPLCQDRETITITCDPFFVRDVEGAKVDFTCSFTTNSKRRLLLKLGKESSPDKGEETTSITKTITLERSLRRVVCSVVDSTGETRATVYCNTETIPDTAVAAPPPPRVIAVIANETFVCANETEQITLACQVHSFGPRRVQIEWRREGSQKLMGYGNEMTLLNVHMDDAGTYICAASDDDVTGAAHIAVMVRRFGMGMRRQYPVNLTDSLESRSHASHGGDYPNHPYQLDAPAVSTNSDNSTSSNRSIPVKKIDPVPPGHPKAIVEPSEVTAKLGSTIALRCSATGEGPLKFYWKSGSNDYIPAHVRASHGALIFRSLRSTDAGVYYCIAWNHLGQSTAKATINLDKSASKSNATEEPLTIEILHPEITARPGDNVNFQCRSNQTGVSFHWTKVGEKMTNASQERVDGLLTLYRVGESEKGTYQCTVSNEAGERVVAQAVLKLKKLGERIVPPKVTIRPKSPLRIRTGATVRLECEGSGIPQPNVTWVRSINGKDKKLVGSPTNIAVYEIKQMTTTDVGKYACSAISEAGKQSESMSLVIDDGQPCKETEFRCKSGDQCIPREDRCDAEKDCRDGSDEANCKGSRRVRRHLKKNL